MSEMVGETKEARTMIHLRLPKEMLPNLKEAAKSKKWTVNTLITDVLEKWLKYGK